MTYFSTESYISGMVHSKGQFNFYSKLRGQMLVLKDVLLKGRVCSHPCRNSRYLQYIPRNMHTVFALLCFVVVIHWLIFPYPSGLLHWHCGNLTIAPVPAKQPWWIWINTSCEFIMNDCITTTKQSTTKPCAYFLGYTVHSCIDLPIICHGSWCVFVINVMQTTVQGIVQYIPRNLHTVLLCFVLCFVLLCCGYAIVHNEFTWSIYPSPSGLLCWHWGNR